MKQFPPVQRNLYSLLLLLITNLAHAQTIVYVTPSGAGNQAGSSWANASPGNQLQAKINAATAGSQVWVAAGTYKPTDGTDRAIYFSMKEGVAIYGGFTGNETQVTQRPPITALQPSVTILSGDIGTAGLNNDNSYHVIYNNQNNLTPAAILDGFVITSGNANASSPNNDGGGMYNSHVSPTIRQCTFISNNAGSGGGGMANFNSSPGLGNCVFRYNSSGTYGGSVYLDNSNPQIINCSFSGNSSGVAQTIYAGYSSHPGLTNCSFTGNSGSLYLQNTCSANIFNCILWDNATAGINFESGAQVTMYNTDIAQGGYAGTNGNISYDPVFENAATGDLRLKWYAPCINKGNNLYNSTSVDLGGNPRKWGIIDMGAFEFQSDPCPVYNTLYVDAGTATPGDGSSWASPLRELRDALATASRCNVITTINVAGGTYKPTADANRDSSFNIYRGGLKIYGGYPAGGGTRDVIANPTILSGDIGIVNDSTDNSYHVLVIANPGAGADSLIVDGFTITGGNADGNAYKLYNGVFVYQNYGGGIHAINQVNSKTVIRNSIVKNNTATYGGGGMFNSSSSSPQLVNCTFTGNNVPTFYGGGGIYNRNSSPVLTNCTFTSNSGRGGGGMFNEASSPILTGCLFSFNNSLNGGGLINYSGSSPWLIRCTFNLNTSGNGGGACNDGGTAEYINCVFASNQAMGGGGGMHSLTSASCKLVNCVFINNKAGSGSALGNTNSAVTNLRNCTITGNNGNGSLYNVNGAIFIIANTIIWGNTGSNTGISNSSSVTVTYSDVQGGYAGTGNINSNPLFINAGDADGNDNIFGTADDGLLLQVVSPAADRGNNDSIPAGVTTDIAAAIRIQNGFVDMGAYEGSNCPSFTTLYVDNGIATPGNGSSWSGAFKELRDALLAAAQCSSINTINVAKGTYKPTGDANRDSAFVIPRGGLRIYGGYPAGGGTRNIAANPTILSGDIGAAGSASDNSYHVMVIAGLTAAADSLVVDGLTVTGGYANDMGSKNYNGYTVSQNEGGGIDLHNNNAAGYKIMFRNCTVTGNAALFYGGGMYNQQSSPAVSGCVFSNNSSYIGNGQYSDAGGGLFNYNYSAPRIVNCLFTGNNAGRGAAIHNYSYSSPVIVNCTITGNNGGGTAGIFNEFFCNAEINNCIVWNNTGSTPGIVNTNSSEAAVTNSIVQDGYTGTGNLNTSPLFINAADADGADDILGTSDDGLRLQLGSPAINAGSNASLPALTATDITGASRIQNSVVDMGAYEGGRCSSFTTLYVDNNSATSGNGGSWSSPFKEFREALAVARECTGITQILVARGTYLSTGNNSRDSTFMISRGGLKIYGGYPSGGGTRDITANPTLLSGDIGNAGDSTDNSYHVMIISGLPNGSDSLVIDGFTLTGGNANANVTRIYEGESVNQSYGGGIYTGSSVTGKTAIRNCTISNNTADNGGGIRNNSGASPTIVNCVFSDNNAPAGGGISNDNTLSVLTGCSFARNNAATYGGGILNWTGSSVKLINCTFTSNTSASGAGIYNYSSAPSITGCAFAGNNAANRGGGIYNNNSSPAVDSCTFTSNISVGGGGIYNQSSSPVLTRCTFRSNTVTSWGGGVFSISSSPVFNYCTFLSNTANFGGGIHNQTSLPLIKNCTFSANHVSSTGGGMYNTSTSVVELANCVFTNNVSANEGGGIGIGGTSTVYLRNCDITGNSSVTSGGIINFAGCTAVIANSIIWANTGATPGISNAGTATVTYSDVQGGFAGAGNFNADPLFLDAADGDGADDIWGTADDGLRLSPCSPAINTGNRDSIPTVINTDMAGNARVAYSEVDMGPYEVQNINMTQATWNGINTSWSDKANWCGGFIPGATTDVTIPAGRANYPVIATGSTALVRNITIAAAAALLINANGTLNASGNVDNNGLITADGKIILSGAAAQTFPGPGIITDVKELEVANTGAGVSINNSVGITGQLTPTSGILNLGDYNITLRSSATATAAVPEVKSTAGFTYGNGRFVIERFINVGTPSATVHGKSWQFLSTPVQGTATDPTARTIRETWQENGITGSTGYGAWITDPGYTASNGFDGTSAGASIKTYTPLNDNWQSLPPVTGTNIPLSNKKGYMLFVRGDRSIIGTGSPAATPTTLRMAGKLYDRLIPPPATTVANGFFESAGNPYASAIDLKKVLNRSTNIDNVFYVWDPSLTGTYGLGGYQTISGVTGYVVTPGGGKIYNLPDHDYSAIQSGQAFFIKGAQSGGTGSLSFDEEDKTADNFLAGRGSAHQLRGTGIAMLSTLLVTTAGEIADGNRVIFDSAYSNAVDGNDAVKIMNSGENFGLLRNTRNLAVEARQPLQLQDTLFYKMSNLQAGDYRLMTAVQNMPAAELTATLVDKYAGTRTMVSLVDTSWVSIEVKADAPSKAADRFMLVFTRLVPLPVTFIAVSGTRNADHSIKVKWQVAEEQGIGQYSIERSIDGRIFTGIAMVAATGAYTYTTTDGNPPAADNYYRVKAIETDGTTKYSNVVKVAAEAGSGSVTVFPNPVHEGIVRVHFINQITGKYELRLTDIAGQIIYKGTAAVNTNVFIQTIRLYKTIVAGTYQLRISSGHEQKVINVVIE